MAGPPATPLSPPDRRRAALVCLVLLALVAGIYAGTSRHAFVDFDDYTYVVENPNLDGRVGLADVRNAFAHPYASNWAPLTSLSLALSDAIHGPIAGGYALTNAFLHGLAACLLFLALHRMTGRIGPAAFTAAVFAVHPVHVESVAWVAERKEVLAGVFWMGALWLYPSTLGRPGWRWTGLLLLVSACAMLSKATAVALPVTLWLLDLWPLGRIDSMRSALRCAAAKTPFVAMAAVTSVTTILVQTESGANTSVYTPIELRLLNAARAYASYLGDTVWPVDLAAFYPYPADDVLLSTGTFAAMALLVAMSILALALWRRAPLVTTGWLWFIVVLVPMIGIVRVGGQSHADRYLYVAQTGLVLIAAYGLDDLAARFLPSDRLRRSRIALGTVGVAIVLGLALVAHRQVDVWRDTERLFEHATRVTRDNYFAHRFLGVALWSRGDAQGAERHLRESLRIHPGWGETRLTLATALLQRGSVAEAERELELALRSGADPARGHATRAAIAQRRNDPAGAAAAYERALALSPDDWEALNNLAWIRAASPRPELRDPGRAIELAERARRLEPSSPWVVGTLAAAYAAAGRGAEAEHAQREAIRMLRESGELAPIPDFEARLARYAKGLPPWKIPSTGEAAP